MSSRNRETRRKVVRCHADEAVEHLSALAPHQIPVVAETGSGYSRVIEMCGSHLFWTVDLPDARHHPTVVLMRHRLDEPTGEQWPLKLTDGQVFPEDVRRLRIGELIVAETAND